MEYIGNEAVHKRPQRHNLAVGFARSPSEILDAQRLRYRVFAGEMGANLPSRTPGVDHDIYDPITYGGISCKTTLPAAVMV